jgi:methyl-accepting chemotaxis protein
MRRLVRRLLVGGLALVAVGMPWASAVASRLASPAEWAALAALFFGTGAVIVCAVFLLVIFPRLEVGTLRLTEVAGAVADGDLREGLGDAPVTGFRRQWKIFERMVDSLRRLATNLRSAADENRRTAMLIEAGASAARTAAVAVRDGTGQVKHEADRMANALRALTEDGDRLVALAAEMRDGASDGAERNARMRESATEARGQLGTAGTLVAGLAEDVRGTAEAVEALADATEDVTNFTVLVQQIARQSRLLSLNAAMEAARAGESGDGFAVVAAEVRRLAESAAEGAERTERTVRAIAARVAASREQSRRLAGALDAVTNATGAGVATFGALVQDVEASDRFALRIADAAQATAELARLLDDRLGHVAAGLDTLARVADDVGATGVAQERAADAQGAVASRLAERASALASIAAEFKLPGDGNARTSGARPALGQDAAGAGVVSLTPPLRPSAG